MKEMIFKRNCENSQINLVLWLSFSVFLNVIFVYVVVQLKQILGKKFLKFDGLNQNNKAKTT